MIYKTLHIRIKDRHRKLLLKQAREVNYVWNYVNELSYNNITQRNSFLSSYDIGHYLSGSTKVGLSLYSSTVQYIADTYVNSRQNSGKRVLNWRKSFGKNRSLGWIPLKIGSVKYKNGNLIYQKNKIFVWDSYNISDYNITSGSFNEDSKGCWYLNIIVKCDAKITQNTSAIGIDLGCKESATTSNGDILVGKQYRILEDKLAKTQRANNKNRSRSIHTKIKNRRKDEQHKFTTKLVKENLLIVIGDISSKNLIKTKLAKSVLDAGWYQMKTMLEYKCNHAGVVFMEINEYNTTQTCSNCGCIPDSSPKGRTGLGIRVWTCDECGTTHDRDINAARNILAAGHCRLAGEIH